MSVDVFFYRVNEFRHAAEHSITNSFLSDLSEPAFNDVQPGTTCRNEVKFPGNGRRLGLVKWEVSTVRTPFVMYVVLSGETETSSAEEQLVEGSPDVGG